MMGQNHTMKTEFILTGFSEHPDLKTLLFVVFFAIYLITMGGNINLVILISKEKSLHTPMYIFLGNLALEDSCCACAITPKMLENFFTEDKRISLYECMAQFYFLCTVETADCFLLAHFLSVSLFYGSLFFMYIRPNLLEEGDEDIPAAILFTIVVPLLNPFIYSLRNKEVKSALQKILIKKVISRNFKQTTSTIA
ncbi:olfactory receptor 5K1-like [Heterocephalus glaber]|uniref:Olfactory receptor 5K1-like n=1 Tax=Heterocephalus glaber TaxID=10181 RepID=A0AAX6RDW5_HETGA|nr:olfactory receptor 5K1-like [Heterocephalus glaber]